MTLVPTSPSKIRARTIELTLESSLDTDGNPIVVRFKQVGISLLSPLTGLIPIAVSGDEKDVAAAKEKAKAEMEAMTDQQKADRLRKMIEVACQVIVAAAVEPRFNAPGESDPAKGDLEAITDTDKLTALNRVMGLSGMTVEDKEVADLARFRDDGSAGRPAGVAGREAREATEVAG